MTKFLKISAFTTILLFSANCGWLNRHKKPGKRKNALKHMMHDVTKPGKGKKKHH